MKRFNVYIHSLAVRKALDAVSQTPDGTVKSQVSRVVPLLVDVLEDEKSVNSLALRQAVESLRLLSVTRTWFGYHQHARDAKTSLSKHLNNFLPLYESQL